MADNFADFYTGSMAPPLRMPGGGYSPAPAVSPALSVDAMYQGIYGDPSEGLASRTVRVVPVNPDGTPYATTASATMRGGPGIGYGVQGVATYAQPRAKVNLPNEVYGPDPVPKYQDRMVPSPAALPSPWDDIAPIRAGLSVGGSGRSGLGARRDLSTALSLARAAESMGADPGDTGMFGIPMSSGMAEILATDPKYAAQRTTKFRAPQQQAQQPKAALQRGRSLLDMLFGGAGGNTGQGGGISLANAFTSGGGGASPTSTYTTTPFQEDRFQTTTGAGMPSSMNNERWTTGY
jgi:hypothetical protein